MSIDIIYYTIIMYLDLFLTCGSYFAYAILKNFKSNFKTFFFFITLFLYYNPFVYFEYLQLVMVKQIAKLG